MTYIAFLRGINVGGHNVKMAVLRDIFSSLGFSNVRSYINSGNIFFNSSSTDKPMLTQTIEAALKGALGYDVPTFLRTTEEINAILEQEPFKDITLDSDKRFCVLFTSEHIRSDLQLPISSSKNDMELIGVGQYEAYIVWRIINGRPPSGKFGGNILPSSTTTRFYHTLLKIQAAAKSS